MSAPGFDPRGVAVRRGERLPESLRSAALQLLPVAYLTALFAPTLGEGLLLTLGCVGPVLLAELLPLQSAGRNARPLVAWPSRVGRRAFWIGLLPAAVAPILLVLSGFGGWLASERLRSVVLVVVATAAIGAIARFQQAQRRLGTPAEAPEEGFVSDEGGDRSHDQGPDPDATATRSCLVRLQTAVAVPALAALLLLADVADHAQDQRRTERALAWSERALEAVAAAESAESGHSVEPRTERVLLAEGLRPAAVELIHLESGTPGATDAPSLPPVWRAALGPDRTGAGRLPPAAGAAGGAYRRLADGSLLLARVDRAALAEGASAWGGRGLLVVLVAGLLAWWLARRSAEDVRGALEALRARAERLASGELGDAPPLRRDDELATLDAALVRLGHTTRATVDHTAETVERLAETIERSTEALDAITASSAEQARQGEEARALMARVIDGVVDASRSAEELTRTLDESSRSVLEVGAAGEELNETASVLTSKVETVSDSLEQMVRSVKQVGSTTDRLAEASEETSSSMEQMAAAMRAVDTSAETTARLSRDVVEKAELGQAKVVQTIAGMEAIREATDAAERVIRGLGNRTHEIGGILDVIDDVADETNLLALNAAIIAAQAGEQGKAFSVVAEEIKELADRVLASTKEIGGLIRSVQEESENAIGAIEAGSASVMSGVDLSAEAGRVLEEITVASRESGTRIGEIVASVREQTKAASHVVGLMERVRESADRIAEAGGDQERGNEVVYRSALTMREVAQQVRRTTEEQAAGFGRIRGNVEGVRGTAGRITGSLGEQAEACSRVTELLDEVAAGSRSNEKAASTLREAVGTLAEQAVGLRAEIEGFRR